MAVNEVQKITILDVNANTLQLIQDKLLLGWVIISITSLQPLFAKLLIVYVTPEVI
jgi:hypothetical protein